MKRKPTIPDPALFWLAVAATFIGIIAIWDSGYARAAANGSFLPRELLTQVPFAVLAVWLGVVMSRIPTAKWRRIGVGAYVVCLVALLLVEVPGIGKTINGSQRWIALGPLTVQPAEFAKLAVILFLAAVLANRPPREKVVRKVRNWAEALDKNFVPLLRRAMPLILVAGMAVLIEQEPDLATAAVIVATTFMMLIVGGVSGKSLVTLAVAGTVLVTGFVASQPYRMDRIVNHTTRWSVENVDSIGYQTTQSETAMARGGFFGVGLGNGRAKHTLPAPTTDFVLATVSEELGLFGSMIVLGILGAIVLRLFCLAQANKDPFGKLVLSGVASWIGVQTCTNIMMANGTLPPIGIPLPFVSAGGSSLVALWIALGVCQSVAKHTPEEVAAVEVSRDRRWNRRAYISSA